MSKATSKKEVSPIRLTVPWPQAVDGATLLHDLRRSFTRYMALPEHSATALALWVVFAHAHDAYTISPLLVVKSPTMRCGKTTLLSVLEQLVPKALFATNVTPAVVFRMVDQYAPTLLIDEADTFLARNSELVGVINSGHNRFSAHVPRLVGDQYEPKLFSTWSPKAIALIRNLPATLEDRSVIVPLRRKLPSEQVERLRMDRLDELNELREKAARWAIDHIDELRRADPDIPNGLSDRGADNWRPLLAIADAVGGDWPSESRSAAEGLSGGEEASSDKSLHSRLLQDIQYVFQAIGETQLPSNELCLELAKIEEGPWADFSGGAAITPSALATLLKPFGVMPKDYSFGGKTLKGYRIRSFTDAFQRYLSDEGQGGQDEPQEEILAALAVNPTEGGK